MPTLVSNKLKELEAARAKLATLEQAVRTELSKELRSLPAKYGFASADEFADAVRLATGGRSARGRGRPAGKPGAPGKKRRHRSVITDDTRAQVKKLVEAGKTGAEIAKQVGISLPSVQNIKKALGLVKKR
ncbi:MAG TPA: helix-turn-helix domain-containing protein [Opitutaceae bacterium]|nr:helix-turn-helix domain-containing protein [Opitutaceae bacterium]